MNPDQDAERYDALTIRRAKLWTPGSGVPEGEAPEVTAEIVPEDEIKPKNLADTLRDQGNVKMADIVERHYLAQDRKRSSRRKKGKAQRAARKKGRKR
jgi:hypothetical protein